MDLRKITENFSVSPQIEAADVPAIAAAGFRSILCNRSNDEEPGQCCFEEVAEAAGAAGIEVRTVPISSGMVRAEDMAAFRAALEQMPRPVLAYCRSGTRCTMLWSIAHYEEMAPEDILDLTSKAGYDMSGVIRQLAQR